MSSRKRGRAGVADRERIRRRDNGLCQSCLRAGRVTLGDDVDHIIGLAQGGTDDDSNKELKCYDCHTDKTARDNGKRTKTRIGADGMPIGDHHWNT